MSHSAKWSLRSQLVILGVLLPTVLIGFLLIRYRDQSRKDTLTAFQDKARTACLISESVRENMEKKWTIQLFNVAQMQDWGKKGQIDKIMEAVPVFASISAISAQADASGFTFKVPKFQPRNPANQPDPFESRVLKILTDQGLSEYHEIDPQINAVRYFRAVRLTETCMICHGDPATAKEIWGNAEGLDITGAKMENWKAGEIHGAFEIIQSLNPAEAKLAASLKNALTISGGGLLLMAAIFATLIIGLVSRSVILPVRRIIDEVSSNSGNLRDAARHISESSHQLSAGAVSQAASIEQSAAALEEVTAMTQSNANNIHQTSEVAAEVLASVDTARVRMERMSEAINAIKTSSDKTFSIVKTIDEIAFQTNLLSLNAAVEAARAGEAGSGFAVVAGEVRTLAMRSSNAARQTTELIEEARSNSARGVAAVEEVQEILTEIIRGANRVTELSREISVASKEQAEGVRQVNIGVAEIEKVTQTNAAVSEEVASTSEELSSQAQSLNDTIGILVNIVGGEKSTQLQQAERLVRTGKPLITHRQDKDS